MFIYFNSIILGKYSIDHNRIIIRYNGTFEVDT